MYRYRVPKTRQKHTGTKKGGKTILQGSLDVGLLTPNYAVSVTDTTKYIYVPLRFNRIKIFFTKKLQIWIKALENTLTRLKAVKRTHNYYWRRFTERAFCKILFWLSKWCIRFITMSLRDFYAPLLTGREVEYHFVTKPRNFPRQPRLWIRRRQLEIKN